MNLQNLPIEILQHICVQFDSVDDVLSLQASCRRLQWAIDASFWRLPRVLCIGTEAAKSEGESTIRLLTESQRQIKLPNDVETLRVVLEKAHLIRELQLTRNVNLTLGDQKYALDLLLRTSDIRLKRITVTCSTSESLSGTSEPDACWPSHSIQKRLCRLISSQRHSPLQYLCIRFDSGEFMKFERNASKTDLSVHVAYQKDVNVFLQSLYPFTTAFNHHSISPKSVRVIVDVEDSRAQRALQDAMHSLQFSQREKIRDLRIYLPRISSSEAAKIVVDSFENYLCNLRSLRSLCWMLTDVVSHVGELKSCFPQTEFSTFVSAPTRTQVIAQDSPFILTAPPLIRCL